MKYMLMLFADESQWEGETGSEEDLAAMMQLYDDFSTWCTNNGVTVTSGEELQLSPDALTFHADGRETDGPFLEVKEQLGGFYVIETDSLDLAKEAARRVPNFGATELRPVMVRNQE